MSEIKAADVSKLRKSTGAGMMDCKKALVESEGDFDKAVKILRKKGQAIANKRSGREAGEGVVLAKVTEDNHIGAMVAVNCETDFVAKNRDFIDFAYTILDIALNNKPKDIEDLKKMELGGKAISEAIIDKMGVIGEKIETTCYEILEAPFVISYIHPGNKLATLVGFNRENVDVQVARDIAMQVAAMNPAAIDKDNVPQNIIDQETEIGKEQARREGKPEELLEKIALGKLNKFFKESTLLNQEFIKESKKTVRQYLQEKGGDDLSVLGFKRYTLNI